MATPRETTDDEPLDPAIERIRLKLSRLVLISMGTLALGLVAVLAAVIYRATGGGSTELPGGTGTIRLVAGAEVVSADLEGDRILLRIAMPDGATELVVVDVATARPGLRLRLEPNPLPNPPPNPLPNSELSAGAAPTD